MTSVSTAITVSAPVVSLVLPSLIAAAGEDAQRHTLEFFTARLPNAHTREAYGRAVARFCAWCDTHGVELAAISAPIVAVYVQSLQQALRIASVKQHLAVLRHWMDWLTERGVLRVNPAAAVRGPRHAVQEVKTPVLERDQARRLLEVLDGDDLLSLRDRALIAVMLFGFVRVGALVKMRVRDFDDAGGEAWLVLEEKGGKDWRLPAHHLVREALRAYLAVTALEPRSKAPLFQSAPRKAPGLSGKPLSRHDVLAMAKRRCVEAGLPANICNHSFRATGITIHQESGGRIEDAAELAGHASTRTTQLYNRKLRKIARAEVERVQL